MPRHTRDLLDGDNLLTSEEVAALFRVEPRTVRDWTRPTRTGAQPVLSCIVLPSGRGLRYRESEVKALLEGDTESEARHGQ